MAGPGDPNYKYSVNSYTTDGVQTQFEISFAGGYISRDYVSVKFVSASGNTSYPLFTFVGDYQISLDPAPEAGGILTIYRNTPADKPTVDFADGAVINEATLDINARQAVHLAAETRDIVGTVPTLDALQSAQAALAFARSRENHTGTQAMGTVDGLLPLAAANATFTTAGAGMAATSDGIEFTVNNGDGTATVYLNNGGVAVAQRTLATTAALAGDAGAALVSAKAPGPGGSKLTVYSKMFETVSIYDKGAVAGADISQAIRDAVADLKARGAGVLNFRGINALVSRVQIDGAKNIVFDFEGATLTKTSPASGSDSSLFWLRDGNDKVIFENWALLDGGFAGDTAVTTGTRPAILVGDDLRTVAARNHDILFRGGRLSRSNWGGIVVYGNSSADGTLVPLMSKIAVEDVVFDKCSNAIFGYKNIQGLRLRRLKATNCGSNGFVVDTRAESDTRPSEAVYGVDWEDLEVDGFGMVTGGGGVVFKGSIIDPWADAVVVRNGKQSTAAGYTLNYGVGVVGDFSSMVPQRPRFGDILVEDIDSKVAGLGYGMQVAGDVPGLDVGRLVARRTTNHSILIQAGCVDPRIRELDAEECGDGIYMARAEGTVAKPIINPQFDKVKLKKGVKTSTGGLYTNYTSGGYVRPVETDDFTSSTYFVSLNADRLSRLRAFDGSALPATGRYFVGDRFRINDATVAKVVTEYECIIAGTPGTWRPISWIVARAPTANRPTLTASDVGVTFDDITLAAGGKLIKWTGTGWTDLLGAAV